MVVTAPSPTVVQLAGLSPSGEPILSVLAKRTYSVVPGRPLVLAAEQLPLRGEPVVDPEREGLMLLDEDTYPFKLRTDVVVRGHVYGNGKSEVTAEVGVGDVTLKILALGDRRVERAGGTITFGPAAAFDRIPLEHDRAYGGHDRRAEEKQGHPFAKLKPYLLANTSLLAYSPFVYPRNRHGRGYVCEDSAETLAELRLPNLEDPADRLTASRLVVPSMKDWWRMPLPASTTWVPPSYFGRGVFGGMFPFWEPLPKELPEFVRGLLPREAAEIDLMKGHPLIRRFANGAPLALQVPYLKPGATLRLVNLHPKSASFTIALPASAPRISVDGRDGKMLVTEPVIHHVEIEPDENRVTIVWRGAGPARRQYLPMELERMPLRVEWPESR